MTQNERYVIEDIEEIANKNDKVITLIHDENVRYNTSELQKERAFADAILHLLKRIQNLEGKNQNKTEEEYDVDEKHHFNKREIDFCFIGTKELFINQDPEIGNPKVCHCMPCTLDRIYPNN